MYGKISLQINTYLNMMHELLEKEKKKDKYLLLFFIVIFLFAAFALTYYFWQKNQSDKNIPAESASVVIQREQPQQPHIMQQEIPQQRRIQAPPPKLELFKCIDPATGAMSLAHTCPRGFTTERIETQDSGGIKPTRLRRPSPSSNTQQNQITVIPNISREVKKCDDYYNPKISRVLRLSSSEYVRRKLAELRENKEKCIRAANRGEAIIYPVIV